MISDNIPRDTLSGSQKLKSSVFSNNQRIPFQLRIYSLLAKFPALRVLLGIVFESGMSIFFMFHHSTSMSYSSDWVNSAFGSYGFRFNSDGIAISALNVINGCHLSAYYLPTATSSVYYAEELPQATYFDSGEKKHESDGSCSLCRGVTKGFINNISSILTNNLLADLKKICTTYE